MAYPESEIQLAVQKVRAEIAADEAAKLPMTAGQQIRAKALELAVRQSAGTGFGPMETAKEFERYIREGK